MGTLLVVGFVAGVVTALSPCVLPVLPVVLAGGASGSRRRAVAVVVGLVASFSLATLFGVVVLSALGMPADLLDDAGIALLGLLAIGLVFEPVGQLLERPFAAMSTRPRVGAGTSSGVVLGAGLGLVFVPCAGPVLTAIATVAATHRIGLTALALTASYAAGVAVPLVAVALLSARLASRWPAIRDHARSVRRVSGAIIGAVAVVLATGVAAPLQTALPGYATSIESHLVTAGVQSQLSAVEGERANSFAAAQAAAVPASLPDEGVAPAFTGITAWLNTTRDRPPSLASLRGKVVLVDFWTYSCINCRRALPHVEAWYRAYARFGLVVVGVHTPEFAFEQVTGNVAAAAGGLGVTYPIALDDNYATWRAYNNEYWPAEYLVDQHGHVRHTVLGEGDYAATEQAIRTLLIAGGARHLPAPTQVADRTPRDSTTPESYLGYARLANNGGQPVTDDRATTYRVPSGVPADSVVFEGGWDVHADDAVAGSRAVLDLRFTAKDVYVVLAGEGSVVLRYDGSRVRTIRVAGVPNLYTLHSSRSVDNGLLSLSVPPGVRAYDFTFG